VAVVLLHVGAAQHGWEECGRLCDVAGVLFELYKVVQACDSYFRFCPLSIAKLCKRTEYVSPRHEGGLQAVLITALRSRTGRQPGCSVLQRDA
jgi:hypothetical protein